MEVRCLVAFSNANSIGVELRRHWTYLHSMCLKVALMEGWWAMEWVSNWGIRGHKTTMKSWNPHYERHRSQQFEHRNNSSAILCRSHFLSKGVNWLVPRKFYHGSSTLNTETGVLGEHLLKDQRSAIQPGFSWGISRGALRNSLHRCKLHRGSR